VAVEAPAVVGAEWSTTPLNAPPVPKASVDALPAARQAATAPERPTVAAPERPAVAPPEQPAEERAAESVVPEPGAAERVASAPSPPAAPPTPERFAFGVSVNFVSEGDAAAAVLVVRNGGNRGVSEITWWTSAGTASAGVDYADLGTVVEKFAAGQQNRTIRIPIVGDRVVEGPETFYVHLATSEGEVASSEQGQTEVVINDDD
jgi:hypothetical protein